MEKTALKKEDLFVLLKNIRKLNSPLVNTKSY